MTSCHLIPYLDFSLLGNIHFGHLDNTCRKFIPNSQVKLLTAQFSIQFFILLQIVQNNLLDQFILMLICSPGTHLNRIIIQFFQSTTGKLNALRDNFRIHIIPYPNRSTSIGQSHQLIYQQILQFSHFFFIFFVQFRKNSFIGRLRLTLLDCFREQFRIDNDTTQRRSGLQGSILYISGFITKDSAQQFFLRRRIRLTLRGNLTNQYISRLYTCTHTDDTSFIQIFRCIFAYVRNIRS